MSNAVKALGAQARGDLFYFREEDLTLVRDTGHVLYDPRAQDELDENLVRNIYANGINQPLFVRRGKEERASGHPSLEIVDGRNRYRAVCVANKQRIADGLEPHRIPCIRKQLTDAQAFNLMILSNEGRRNDPPTEVAKKMARARDMGFGLGEIAIMFCRSAAAVDKHLALLDAPEDVQAAVEKRELSVSNAAAVAALPVAERKEVLAVKGRKTVKAVRKATGKHIGRSKLKEIRPYKEIAGLRDKLSASVDAAALVVLLDWVLCRGDSPV